MNCAELQSRHSGRPAFCLGTAPHLSQLDLAALKGQVVIGCNQLVKQAAQYGFGYICFQRDERFRPLRDSLANAADTLFVVPEEVLARNDDWRPPASVKDRLVPVVTRFTSARHTEFFSHDLTRCVYAGNVIALEVQLAVWLGCNPIYLLGVDAKLADPQAPFYENAAGLDMDVAKVTSFVFPDTREWLEKTYHYLGARGTALINAAGELSSLDVLPRMRYRAAVGQPTVAVTSKTFCEDRYLTRELSRYFGDVRLNTAKGKLAGDKLVDFLADADAVILGTEPLTGEVMSRLPLLRYVSKYGVGLDNVDFAAAKRLGIEVAYRKGTNSDSVGELTLALCVMMLRRIDESVQGFRAGQWRKLPGRELAEMTVGIVGYGHVGKVVARKFAALGVGRLLVNDLLELPVESPGESVPLEYLQRESDIISFHVSMEPQNRHLVNAAFLQGMKAGSYLINTARGELIDEDALVAALTAGHLAGAALDVYAEEPEPNPALRTCPRLLTTCHIAGSSQRAITTMGWAAIEELLRLLHRSPNQ